MFRIERLLVSAIFFLASQTLLYSCNNGQSKEVKNLTFMMGKSATEFSGKYPSNWPPGFELPVHTFIAEDTPIAHANDYHIVGLARLDRDQTLKYFEDELTKLGLQFTREDRNVGIGVTTKLAVKDASLVGWKKIVIAVFPPGEGRITSVPSGEPGDWSYFWLDIH